ncbi:hypothetical protein WG66_016374 [Moniliophthora roreri]|nr:hypothetical protein WG66_016374 [Moniliophthora roreri]
MALRLTAMFPQSRTVRYVVSFVLIAELITMITILSVTLRHTHPDDPSLVTCFPFGVSQYFYAFYLPPLILETILFFLAVWNAIHQLRIRKIWNRNEVLSVLIRDSIFYFLISELFFAGNAALTLYVYKNGVHLGFHEGRTSWLQIPYASSAAANIILVARFTLNLQSAFYKPTLYRSEGDETMTTINWAHTADTSLPGVFEMSTSPRSRHFLDSSNSQNFSG